MNTEGRGGFQKGRSGNPGGRPKEIGEVRDLARQHTPQAIEAMSSIMNDEHAPPAARIASAEALLNRAWGRPSAVLGDDDASEPRQIIVSWAGS